MKHTVLNLYDSLVVPLLQWLEEQGVQLRIGCTANDVIHKTTNGVFEPIALHGTLNGQDEIVQLDEGDPMFAQNGSMTDASSFGWMTAAPA